MVMLPRHSNVNVIALVTVLLKAAADATLTQRLLLWRHNDMTVIVSQNTRGPQRGTQQSVRQRIYGDYRLSIDFIFIEFQCDLLHYLLNNSIDVSESNCRVGIVFGVFKKCSGFRPSNTSSSWWLDWRRYARVVISKRYYWSPLSVCLTKCRNHKVFLSYHWNKSINHKSRKHSIPKLKLAHRHVCNLNIHLSAKVFFWTNRL